MDYVVTHSSILAQALFFVNMTTMVAIYHQTHRAGVGGVIFNVDNSSVPVVSADIKITPISMDAVSLVGDIGFEPITFSTSMRRSSQMS